MSGPTLGWDPARAAANLRTHGVSFEEAATVFQDPLPKIHSDPDHSASQDRADWAFEIRSSPAGRVHGQAGSNSTDQRSADHARLRGRTVAVVLGPDVAAAFPDSKAVNRLK